MKYGLVASFNRPGGNVTGLVFRSIELASKRLDFLSELVPQATKVAYLSGSASLLTFEEQKSNMLAAASTLKRQIIVLECRSNRDIETAFATMVERGAGAFIVGVFPLFYELRNRDRIVALAAYHKIPAMYPHRMYPVAGGLMSYSTDAGAYREVGVNYVGRI